MPKPNLDLSDVTLPPENANDKVPLNPDAADEGYTGAAPADGGGTVKTEDLVASLGDEYNPPKPAGQKPAEEKKEEAKADDTKPEDKPAAPDNAGADAKKPEEQPAGDPPKTDDPATPEGAKADEKKPEDKPADLAPFHEHPDWKKNQERLRELELENAKLKGAQEVLTKTPEQKAEEHKEDKKTAAQIADERFRQKVADGWSPKDRAEEMRVHAEMVEEELDKKFAARAKEEQEAREQVESARKTAAEVVTKTIDDTFSELKVTDQAQQDLVANRVNEWKAKGLFTVTAQNVNEALKLAHQQLKAEGKLTEAAAPAPKPAELTEEQKAAAAADKKAKDDANRMIAKPTPSDSTPSSTTKRDYKKDSRTDLDTIVQEAGKKLLG